MRQNLLVDPNKKGESTLVVNYSAKNPFDSGQLKTNQDKVYTKVKQILLVIVLSNSLTFCDCSFFDTVSKHK